MKAYVGTTGVLFGLLTVAHIWRMVGGERQFAADPWYIAITLTTAGLSLWAWRVLRAMPRA